MDSSRWMSTGSRIEKEVSAQLKQWHHGRHEVQSGNAQPANGDSTAYWDSSHGGTHTSQKSSRPRNATIEANTKKTIEESTYRGDLGFIDHRLHKDRLQDVMSDVNSIPSACNAEDPQLNQYFRMQTRWNDPMTSFTEVSCSTSPRIGLHKRRPIYSRTSAPNRYGLRPGHRWDGVNRGIGTESRRFQALTPKKRHEASAYACLT